MAKQDLSENQLESGYIVRRMKTPGVKSGVYFKSRPETEDEVIQCIKALPLTDAALYLLYECWGGSVYHIEGFVIKDGAIVVGSKFEYDHIEAGQMLAQVFDSFGIRLEDSGYFEPFTRGYWGELDDS